MNKRVLVGVDEGLWKGMKARASLLGKSVPEVVNWAFRVYLSNQEDSGVESPKNIAEMAAGGVSGSVESESQAERVARVRALMNAEVPGSVTTGRALTTTARGDESGSQERSDDDEGHTF